VITNPQLLRWPAVLPCSEEPGGGGGRCPGNQSHLRAFSGVPRRFTIENHRLPLALPQSFGKLRKSHVSLNPLSASLLRLATEKPYLVVQKLWTM